MADQILDRRDNRKFDVDREVMEFYCKHIGGNAFTVYSYLAMYSSFTPTVFPKHKTIAEATGIGLTTVGKCLKILSGAYGTPLFETPYPPLISIVPRMRERGGKSSNLYVLENVPGRSVLTELDGRSSKSDDRDRQNLMIANSEADVTGPDGERKCSGFAPNDAHRVVDLDDTSQSPNVQPVDLILAWCRIIGVDVAKIPNSKAQFRAAKEMAKAGVEPSHIQELYEYAKEDFRGKRGVDMIVMNAVSGRYLSIAHEEKTRPVRNIV